MRKITILTALLLSTIVLLSQNPKKILIGESNKSGVLENTCADYKNGKYDNAIIVFNTNLSGLKFEIVNAKNNLVSVKPDLEKNRYVLCIEPMGDLYSVYRIEISGKEIMTKSFTIEDIKPNEKRFYSLTVEGEKKYVYPKKIFFEGNFSWSPQPQWAFGLTFGQFERLGWYFSFMTNFNFKGEGEWNQNSDRLKCDKNGFIDSELPFYTGKTSKTRISFTVGFIGKILPPWAVYVGVGVGYRALYWEITNIDERGELTNKRWVKNSAFTTLGVDIESGFMLDLKGFMLSAGVITTNFNRLDVKIGIGFAIK